MKIKIQRFNKTSGKYERREVPAWLPTTIYGERFAVIGEVDRPGFFNLTHIQTGAKIGASTAGSKIGAQRAGIAEVKKHGRARFREIKKRTLKFIHEQEAK